ncbi:PAC2 family protein [Candidatus Woesearchaeota archaeon]|nr:PAC2 family protein [Candidatus Woesearchaeota archaeon]
MNGWKIKQIGKKPKLTNVVLIEGLPGIGNVGKVAVDFIIDALKAEKIYELFSYTFPHSVFVNEKNLVELPSIEIYYKKVKGNDLLLLAGDVQPIDEVSCYEFCEKILDIVDSFKGKEIITLGGVGLQTVPKKPKIYCTGNSKKIVSKYKKGTDVNEKLHGIVGPIVGVSGILLGLAEKRKIPAIAFLAETFGHPMYLGVKGARETLKVLNKKLNLKINIKDMDKEIKDIESEMIKRTEELSEVSRQTALKKVKGKLKKEISYIG